MLFCPFRAQRQALTAAAVTPITPPHYYKSVTIMNAGPDDIRVLHDSTDLNNYVVIGAGFERTFSTSLPHGFTPKFDPNQVSFWLIAQNLDSTAVLLWW